MKSNRDNPKSFLTKSALARTQHSVSILTSALCEIIEDLRSFALVHVIAEGFLFHSWVSMLQFVELQDHYYELLGDSFCEGFAKADSMATQEWSI